MPAASHPLLWLACLTAIGPLAAGPAAAEPAVKPVAAKQPDKAYEIIGLLGLGGSPFSAVSTRLPSTNQYFTFYGALRLRLPKYTPLALEASTVFAGTFGLGLNVLCDVVRTRRLRLHLGDPGIFFNLYKQVTANRWERDFDLTFGLGAEIRPSLSQRYGHYRITADLRWFMPNPFEAQNKLGSFAIPVYEDAAKGVQIWIGLARTF